MEFMKKSRVVMANIKVRQMISVREMLIFSGTWVPLGEGRALAQKNGVLDKLSKIFDFVAGDRSPPPAPKHATAASNRTKAPKASQPRAPAPPPAPAPAARPQPVAGYYRANDPQYETLIMPPSDAVSGDMTPQSTSFIGEEEAYSSQADPMSLRRPRANQIYSPTDWEHISFGDALLDYFMVSDKDTNTAQLAIPAIPDSFPINSSIDNRGYNALHWASSMGDCRVARVLLDRGADPMAPAELSGETPLIRAVLFTNNYDRQTFPRLVGLLANTLLERDWHGANVFHHVAQTARSRNKWDAARYYSEVLVNKLRESGEGWLQSALTSCDKNQDTPVLIAARNGCLEVASLLLNNCPEAGDIANLHGQAANDVLRSVARTQQVLDEDDDIMKDDTAGPPPKKSRAATNLRTSLGPLMEQAADKLAGLYEMDNVEKDMSLEEVKETIDDLDALMHQDKQQIYSMTAQVERESAEIQKLQNEYAALLRETESALEQKDHAKLHAEVRKQDDQVPAQAFRSANPQPMNDAEMRAAIPWAKELHRQQLLRRENVRELARLMGDAGTSQTISKYRRLISMVTEVEEDVLDAMSAELLESLEALESNTTMQM